MIPIQIADYDDYKNIVKCDEDVDDSENDLIEQQEHDDLMEDYELHNTQVEDDGPYRESYGY